MPEGYIDWLRIKSITVYKILFMSGFIIFMIWHWNCTPCANCNYYKQIYPKEIKAKVLEVKNEFREDFGRETNFVVIKNWDDSIYELINFYRDEIFSKDSFYKSKNSLQYRVYRKDSIIKAGDLDCNCSYVNNGN